MGKYNQNRGQNGNIEVRSTNSGWLAVESKRGEREHMASKCVDRKEETWRTSEKIF